MKSLFFLLAIFFTPLLNGDEFFEALNTKVVQAIEQGNKTPGLKEFWEKLTEEKALLFTGEDQQYRPLIVGLQGVLEQVLTDELGSNINFFEGVFLTPLPPTPLCTEGEISPGLVSSEIEQDPLRAFTVQSRATTVRNMLAKGALITTCYPESALQKRTPEQLAIFHSLLEKYPTKLINLPLKTVDLIPSDLIGALYQFRTPTGLRYIFAVQITQANSPQDEGQFGIWLGTDKDPSVRARVEQVMDFIFKTVYQFKL